MIVTVWCPTCKKEHRIPGGGAVLCCGNSIAIKSEEIMPKFEVPTLTEKDIERIHAESAAIRKEWEARRRREAAAFRPATVGDVESMLHSFETRVREIVREELERAKVGG